MARRVNREAVVVLGWGRAILLQLAHPLVAAGVGGHSAFDAGALAYVRRMRRTIGAMLSLTFGSESEIRETAGRINAIHRRVRGRLDSAVGGYPAGARYDAADPALLTWVHATLVDSQLRTCALFVGPLTRDDEDRYCAEAAGIGPRLGVPADALPDTRDRLDRYLDRMRKRGDVWRILHRRVVMDWNQNAAASAVLSGPPFDGLARGARHPQDPLYAHLAD